MDPIQAHRAMMKSGFGVSRAAASDQMKGHAPPPLQKPCPPGAIVADLPEPAGKTLKTPNLDRCFRRRRSRRAFTRGSLSLDELSYLLWCTQGIDSAAPDGSSSMRPAPSAGARHPFETYLVVQRVTGLAPGVYRYLPVGHQVVLEFEEIDLPGKLTAATLGQTFVGEGAVVFVWSCVPYRGEWRYTAHAHKVMLMDAGHLCQNLYLACEAMGCGTCAIGACDQQAMDQLVRLDGNDEFVAYLAPVGRV